MEPSAPCASYHVGMRENLRDMAAVQYDDWVGTLAADEADLHPITDLLGVDREKWFLLVVEVSVFGGSQSIVGYAVPAEVDYTSLEAQIRSTGRIEVVRVVETHEDPSDHEDTNPPDSPVRPITWATDLLAFGFKRFHLRMQWKPQGFGDSYDIVEIGSAVND